MSVTKKRVVMITGGAGQLGRAVEAAFARTGARRLVADIDETALRAAYPVESDDRLLVPVDLIDAASVERVVAIATEKFGRVDVLCNIAGGFYYGEPVHATKADIWQHMLDLNALTLINASRAVVPLMIAARSGTIINIGAAAHIHARAHMSAYAAAKGAVMRLTESMAEELRNHGIGVFCLMPEIIDTPANRSDMPTADMSSWTPPSAIADVMVMLSSDEASIMSGALIPVKGRPHHSTKSQ